MPAGLCRLLAGLVPVGLALVLGGCATSSAGETATIRSQAPAARAETEDDGLPAQVSPSLAIRRSPDDPREPFSRSYGPRAYGPGSLFGLAGPPARMTPAEEEALIARAITEHEMRKP
jgi:hypothetical protein